MMFETAPDARHAAANRAAREARAAMLSGFFRALLRR